MIAEKLGIMRQALVPLLNSLEKRNLLLRTGHESDGRRKVVILTPEGVAYTDMIEDAMSAVELSAFAELPEEELAVMFASLSRFRTLLEKRRSVTRPPDSK